ncbi:MAG TPA: aryl-sulfate sulfotransferase [Terriglobia bacterium]|nr:aryl-sulfate sulfotransferase [Terriglobia bacterium]
MKLRSGGWFLTLVLFQAALAIDCGQNQTLTIVPFVDKSAITVSVSPGTGVVSAGQTLQLTASVTGTDQKDIAWSIFSSTPDTGTIDANGLYKAPGRAVMTSVRIQAASVANPTKVAEVTVWVVGPVTVSATNNPLVAQYSMAVPNGGSVRIEFGPDTSYGLDTWEQSPPSGGGQVNILVAGMRASSTYHMRAVVDLPGGLQFRDVDHAFQTGVPPVNRIPAISVNRPGNLAPSAGVELLDLVNVAGIAGNPLEAVVTDLQGNVIWYYDVDPDGSTGALPFPIKPLPNGHFLINATPAGPGGTGTAGVLQEVDLAGNIIQSMTSAELNTRLAAAGFSLVTQAMHHDFLLLPNGHLIVIVNHTKDFADLPGYPGTTPVLGDALIELDQNWQPIWVWDTFDHLDINRHPLAFPDWTHSNALIYSPDDGDLLLSMRDQSLVIKIDYQDGKGSGDILWRLGNQGDFTLTSGGAPAAWQYGQHDIRIVSTNSSGVFNLSMFDNGWIRVMDDNGDLCGTIGQPACYSRSVTFQIDEPNRAASVLWEDSNLPYSLALGSLRMQTNGNVEFDEGFLPDSPWKTVVQEVTPDANPQLVWQLNVDHQPGYRVFRLPSLYPGVQW